MFEEERTKTVLKYSDLCLMNTGNSLVIQAVTGSNLDKAVQYSLNQKEQLNNVNP